MHNKDKKNNMKSLSQLQQKAVEELQIFIEKNKQKMWFDNFKSLENFLFSQIDLAYKEGEKAGYKQGKSDFEVRKL